MNQNFIIIRGLVEGLLLFFLLGVMLFVTAGTIDYWQGWGFMIFNLLRTAIAFPIFSKKKALVTERMKPGPGTKWWDIVYHVVSITFFLGMMTMAGLDVGRFHWSPEIPVWGYVAGYAALVASLFWMYWAMWVNPFFSSTVRIQKDRSQHVIQSGPYRYMRHPGYTGGIISEIAMAITLGSYYALIPAGLAVLALIVRTALKDATLQKELHGYKEYTHKVKYRLIPFIW